MRSSRDTLEQFVRCYPWQAGSKCNLKKPSLHDLLELATKDARTWGNLKNLEAHSEEHKHQQAKKLQRSGEVSDKQLTFTCIVQQAEEDGAAYVAHGGRWNARNQFDAVGEYVAGQKLLDYVSTHPDVITAFTNLPPKSEPLCTSPLNPEGTTISTVGGKVRRPACR